MQQTLTDARAELLARLAKAMRTGDPKSSNRPEVEKMYRDTHGITEADIEEYNRQWRIDLHDRIKRIRARHPEWVDGRPDTRAIKVSERFACMFDAAIMLGGESLESFERCATVLDSREAILSWDSSPLSVCWTGGGLFGGCIFHSYDRTWGIHT